MRTVPRYSESTTRPHLHCWSALDQGRKKLGRSFFSPTPPADFGQVGNTGCMVQTNVIWYTCAPPRAAPAHPERATRPGVFGHVAGKSICTPSPLLPAAGCHSKNHARNISCAVNNRFCQPCDDGRGGCNRLHSRTPQPRATLCCNRLLKTRGR